MAWEKFGYICRRASVDRQDIESISACLSRIENDNSCGIYGKDIPSNSLPRNILNHIGNIKNESEAQGALDIYKELNLTKQFEEPMRFKRVVAYLSYVTFIFYIVVGIYQLKVAPSFLEAFESFDIQIPSHLTFYQDYWGYFVLIVSILLIAALLTGSQLRKLFNFDLGRENGWVVRFLVLPSIRKSYLRIINILKFPILNNSDSKEGDIMLVASHLKQIKESKMNISREMQELIEIEMRILLENCEKQIKYISIVVALIIVSAVFFFLVSAYSPIFILGETV